MADLTHSNLEPIEEGDLDLKDKFLGGAPAVPETKKPEVAAEKAIEPLPTVERAPERKEGAAEKEAAYSKILSQVSPSVAVPVEETEIASDAVKVNDEMDEESKIKNLVSLAELKGIPHAVKVAKHFEDNYLLDEFHDRMLSDEFHDALVKKGMIKEV